MKQFELNNKKYISIHAIKYDGGLYSVVGIAKDLTNEQLKGMVEMNEPYYQIVKQKLFKDYTKEFYKNWTCKTRKESWQSFMRKNDINPNDLILKII